MIAEKFQVSCALFDASMKFGPPIVATNTAFLHKVPSQNYVGFYGNHN